MSVTSVTKATGPVSARVRASVADTVRVLAGVLAPAVAQGPIRRRPRMVRIAARLDVDRRGGEVLQRLRTRYGSGPLLLRLPVGRPLLDGARRTGRLAWPEFDAAHQRQIRRIVHTGLRFRSLSTVDAQGGFDERHPG